MYAEMKERGIAAGRLVKLVDGRIGLIESIKPSKMLDKAGKPETCDRAYVIGVEKEFAASVLFEDIAIVYGIVGGAATTATEAAAVA